MCGEKGTLIYCWWECKLVEPLGRQYGGSLKQLKNGPEVFVQPLFPHWNRLAPATLSSGTSDLHCGCQLNTLLKMPTVEGMISKGLFAVTPRVRIWVEQRWPILQLAVFSIWLCRYHTEKWYDMLWWSCSSLFISFQISHFPLSGLSIACFCWL